MGCERRRCATPGGENIVRHDENSKAAYRSLNGGMDRSAEHTTFVSLADYDAFGSLGKFGLFKGTTIRGKLAQFSHAMLYRSHQARLYGFWRGGLVWLVDRLNVRLRSSIRLD